MTGVVPRIAEAPVAGSGVGRLELEAWRGAYGLVAGVTTRGDDGNLGFGTPDGADRVSARWRSFIASQRPAFRAAVLSHQVHGSRVASHTVYPGDGLLLLDGYDGHLSTAAGLLLTVTVADCIPVYLAHPKSGSVALLHAGWKGIAGGVIEAGIKELLARGASAGDIVMHCGVGICGDCYEVGPEVVAAVSGVAAAGPRHLDLRAAIVARARAAGLREVTVSAHCAAHEPELFYSHRRSRGTDGRMVAYLGRPLA